MKITRCISIVVAFVGGALVSTTAVLLAQEVTSLRTGSRVRVVLTTAPARTLEGTLDAVKPDTLHIAVQRRMGALVDIVPVPLAQIGTLDVSRGTHGHAGWGALIGGGILALAGLASGDDPEGNWFAMTAGEKAMYGAMGGAVLGGLVGLMVRSESWEPVSDFRVAPVTLDGVGIMLQLTF